MIQLRKRDGRAGRKKASCRGMRGLADSALLTASPKSTGMPGDECEKFLAVIRKCHGFTRGYLQKSRGLLPAGFTLLEILVVFVILAVALTFFYTVFITNWEAYQTHITRANLWEECDRIVEIMSASSRDMRQIDITQEQGWQSARLFDPQGQPLATYVMKDDGEFQVVGSDDNVTTLSGHLDFPRSSFAKAGKSLVVNLAFVDRVLARDVRIQTAAEILPRN